MREFGLFHEMGTGKTYTTINLAAARYLKKQIGFLIVICPTPIKNVWEVELKEHHPGEYSYWIYESGNSPYGWIDKEEDNLKVIVVSVESMSLKDGSSRRVIDYIQRRYKTMVVVDESSRIKTYKAKRTKHIIEVGGDAEYRMILTGTPVTQGLIDLYSQFRFLNVNIINCKNFSVFRNRYCVTGGFKGKQILGYQFEENLYKRIAPYVDYVTKEECLDLPDKITPPSIVVLPTDNQKRVIKELTKEFAMKDQGKEIEVTTILERMTRYQQVIGGSFPFEEDGQYSTQPIGGANPKLDAMLEYIEELPNDKKVIIWARFVPEIRYIIAALCAIYGPDSVVDFYGATEQDNRARNSIAFQENPAVRFIVSNQTVGGYGQTWTAATYVIYYSNSFSYEDRYQSEDRCHRKGQNHHVTYQDIEMAIPHDRMILRAIRRKRDLAQDVEEALIESRTLDLGG